MSPSIDTTSTRDYATVVENMIEAALFPPGTPAPYATFGNTTYASTSRGKGKRSFSRWLGSRSYPLIGWYFDEVVEQQIENPMIERVEARAIIVIGHQNPDVEAACRTVARDLKNAADACLRQTSDYSGDLTQGAFFSASTTVVPTAFGTINGFEDVKVYGEKKPAQAEKKTFGPDVVIGAIGIGIVMYVN